MAITPVQPNIEQTKTYRDAKKPIKSANLVHPLPAEGHLVHDSLLAIPKFWLKDIAYDIKAVKDGFNGTAKDHQTGRLNDVGLKLGGIGIATYLASRTTDPKVRLMEYVGLGAFLASMSLYPAIAINGPSRIIQGYDIGKEYIDDQGRKKSVYQDGNYIPFDMYRGEFVGEDLDIIGDRMGIPRDIKNRNELIKEQARKIAIQNNTLWMLTAGFATPVMTALICCGLEKVLTPALELIRNKNYNSSISSILKETQNMTLNVNEILPNTLSEKVNKLLLAYKDKELPQNEFDKLVKMLVDNTDDNLTEGIKEDLKSILSAEKNSFVLSDNINDDILNAIKNNNTGRNKATLEEIFKLSPEELQNVIKNTGSDGKYINADQLKALKGELKRIFGARIETRSTDKAALYMEQDNIIESVSKLIQKTKSQYLSESSINDITDFAKVLGDFKAKDDVLDKCKSFKVEHAPETVLARSYKRFEDTIFGVLNITYKDLRQMKESDEYTKEILQKKIEAFVKDEKQYEKGIKKLAEVMSDMEVKLHGDVSGSSKLLDLINAYENNYNNTAKRINHINNGKFSNTIKKLIQEDVNGDISKAVDSKKNLFRLIDGKQKALYPDFEGKDYGDAVLEYSEQKYKSVGSSKRMKISRIIERLQGVENSQRRLLHLLDFYKRDVNAGEYNNNLNNVIKDILLGATSSDHTLKFRTENNPKYYIDIMESGWNAKDVTEATKNALKQFDDLDKGKLLKRFEAYLKRFKDVMGNNDIDFNKPDHKLVQDLQKSFQKFYDIDSTTRKQKFNLVAQNPIEFFRKASKTRFENIKWAKTASAIGGSVLVATVMAQFCFGKIRNPHNVKKQVQNDNNN